MTVMTQKVYKSPVTKFVHTDDTHLLSGSIGRQEGYVDGNSVLGKELPKNEQVGIWIE